MTISWIFLKYEEVRAMAKLDLFSKDFTKQLEKEIRKSVEKEAKKTS